MTAEQKLDLRAMQMNRNLTWEELKQIPWDTVSVKDAEEYVSARYLAGVARNFSEFYTREERDYAMSVERWLTRYSLEHTHESLRQ